MKINLTQLSTKDLASLSLSTIAVSDEPAFAVVKDNPLLAAVKTEYSYYDLLYAKKAFSGRGEELVVRDENRDTPFGALKDILLGHAKATGSPFQADAQVLYGIVEKYGIGLDRLKYSEETAQMVKLLQELDQPENKARIERLLLTPIVAQIKTAQTAFEELFHELAGINGELKQMQSASSTRRALEVALRDYFHLLTAMNKLAGWKELYGKMDKIVKAVDNKKPGTDTKTESDTPAK